MVMPNFTRSPRPRLLREQMTPTASGWSVGPAVRLLPAVIVAGVFMLGFRVQVVVQNMAHTKQASVELAPSAAMAAAAAPAAATPAPGTAPTPAKEGEPAKDGAAPAETENAEAKGDFDPSKLTKSEIDVLQRLAERRDLVEQRERELVAKDGLMKAAEARIDGKIAQLQDLEKNIKVLLTQYDQQKDAEMEQLKNIYAAMKPKEAARIFDTLDMPILVSLVQKMGVRQSAPILAVMDPQKAKALTEELTSRKQLSNATMTPASAPAAPPAPAAR